MKEEKPIVLLPGDKRVLDGYTPVIHAGTAIFLAVLAFVTISSIVLGLTWINFPFLPLPESAGHTKLYHVLQYFNHWFLGRLVKTSSYFTYGGWMNHIIEIGQLHRILIRHFLATAAGSYAGYKAFIYSWKPIDNQRQIRGKVLLKGKDAFEDLKREYDKQIAATISERFPKGQRGLIMATDKGFKANQKETFDKTAKIIRIPDAARRVHYLFLAGSRRGKGVTLKQLLMQVYYRILNGANDKLMIIDTPKGEYAWMFKQKYTYQIAPDEKHDLQLWFARDLEYDADIRSYWAGRIPANEKEPYWSDSARIIGVAIMVFLRNTCGEDWNLAHFAYWRDQPREKLIEIAKEHFPDALKTLQGASNTVDTHFSTLSTNSSDAIELSRIWNGFHHKTEIHQMSTALLKRIYWLTWFINTAYPLTKVVGEDEDARVEELPENYFTHYLMKGLLKSLNSSTDWKWADLKTLISKPLEEQINIAKGCLIGSEHKFLDQYDTALHARFIKPIITKAELWDMYEGKPRFSLKDWILDDNPEKKILLIKPSGRFNEQTIGLIRGMLFYMKGLVNDKFFPDDKSPDYPGIRRFHVVCDEFQALGNLKEFIGPAMEMFASKGITVYLACQDLSQLKEIYGENFLQFLQANTGNVYLLGTNMGSSAEMISNQLGKKTILKRHESTTYQDNGKSTSVNYQEHDGVVMTPDEINELGSKFEKHRKYVRYLYIPGNMSNAYILEGEIASFPQLYKPEKADWMTGGELEKPMFVPEEEIVAMLNAKPQQKETARAYQTLHFEVTREATHQDQIEDEWEAEFEEEEEIDQQTIYGRQLLEEATSKEERKEIYILPTEDDSLEGSVVEDLAIEAVLDSHLLSTLKSATEVAKNASSAKTTDKNAFLQAMFKKKQERWDTVDRETQR